MGGQVAVVTGGSRGFGCACQTAVTFRGGIETSTLSNFLSRCRLLIYSQDWLDDLSGFAVINCFVNVAEVLVFHELFVGINLFSR